jgi:hypothetical protein
MPKDDCEIVIHERITEIVHTPWGRGSFHLSMTEILNFPCHHEHKSKTSHGLGGMARVPHSHISKGHDVRIANERGISRSILRKGFGNLYNEGLEESPLYYSRNGGSKCGSFRSAFNAGDVNGTENEATNKKYGIEHNTASSGNNLARLNLNPGGIKQNGNSFYAGNPKNVYDASDFLRYRKLKAMNQNYNDLSTGGDKHNASQGAQRRLTM